MEPVWHTKAGTNVRLTVRPDTNDWNICQSIIAEDEYGFDTYKPLTGTAIDVGAHIGAATVALLELNPDLRVVAIEPLPENLDLLRQNTAAYGDRVVIIPKAAGSGEQTIHYNYAGDDEFAVVHRFIGNMHTPDGTGYQSITVPGITLSELVDEYGPIALLKIDCEGCESGFLDDPAIDKVERLVGEHHDGPSVRPITEKPKRETAKDPGEKPVNRRKRPAARKPRASK